MTGGGIERLETPIIEDEQRDAAERSQDASVTAVAARESEIGEELWNALVENGAVITAGFVTERRCKPAFPDAGRARDILPKNIRSKLSFNIRITHAPASASLP